MSSISSAITYLVMEKFFTDTNRTAHVMSGILNVINVVSHYVPGDGEVFHDANIPDMDLL